ncbi:amino acid permease [Mariniblastus fucicola]|uniref:Amino acid permease n=1 Tax=Mariniblastus fucicola TaxID=980251 RepID=A0A5B9P7E1_9BACT|nr:amino acid permease [Mariniblastus fucicola]QEG20870.1 Amino acid permease [Mariniblastus fucicola]
MSSSANPADLAVSNSAPSNRQRNEKPEFQGFGTFGGVFTPCTLTILGVIMFRRFGYVVGNSGLMWALVILLCAKIITTLTTFSLSAVATNTKVKGGGAYFLISRSLGAEFGGAIGIVFFLAQAISVAMYVIGFAEVVNELNGSSVKLVALLTNVVVFICVFIGAGWTIKVQYFILATLVASLISFFLGGFDQFQWTQLSENVGPHFLNTLNADGGGKKENLFTMFALFFPAVTGIMAGANMSGDLKNPSRSIPVGTLWSIVTTAIVYAAMAFFIAGCRPAETLVSNFSVIGEISKWPVLITAGVFAATLSSALGSMMGAPRILQALAKDKIFPRLNLFGVGSGATNEPRRAVIVTFIISSLCIVLADLNTIAPLITMAFMITYGTINIATFYEGITKNPSYRPTFRYSHWVTSLLGAIGCITVMLLMNPLWALASAVMMVGIYFFIYRKQVESQFGDLGSGLLFERTRRNLLKLERTMYHPKNWRPIVLAMSGGGSNRLNLSMFGHWLTRGNGILNIGQVISGNAEEHIDRIANQEQLLEKFIVDEELDAFPNIVAAPKLSEGIEYLVQCSGLGALRPNTLLIGWPGDVEKATPLVSTLRTVQKLRRNVVIARLEPTETPKQAPPGTIDVWWRGRKNGELMLLFAHLLKQNPVWRNQPIRLMRVVSSEEAKADVLKHLHGLADESRIEIEAEVFVSDHPHHVIGKQSKDSAVTILGFELPDAGKEDKFFAQIERLIERLPRVLMVSSIGNVKLES